jgi:hypothetical protein
MEAVFGDIDAAETDTHGFTSSGIIKFEAGEASRPILHFDEGSRTQSTYQDSGRQGTDLPKDSAIREERSPPASFHFNSYHKFMVGGEGKGEGIKGGIYASVFN